jgi:hypothetical protein
LPPTKPSFIGDRGVRSLEVSPSQYVREITYGFITMYRSHIYSGTWSMVVIPYWMFVPFALLWLFALAGVLATIWRGPPERRNLCLVMAALTVPVLAGLAYHMNLRIF